MSLKRYRLELAFQEPMPVQLVSRLQAWENATKAILPDAVIINEGDINEEDTKRFKQHTCYHDETVNKPCDPEQDV